MCCHRLFVNHSIDGDVTFVIVVTAVFVLVCVVAFAVVAVNYSIDGDVTEEGDSFFC